MATRIYLKSVLFLLLITAFGKIAMTLGTAPVLHKPSFLIDSIENRHLLSFAAGLELAAVALILSGWGGSRLSLAVVAWLASLFAVYRLLLWMNGFHGYCDCLGNISEILGLNPTEAVWISRSILIYLLVGSYALLLREWMSQPSIKKMPQEIVRPSL